MLYRLKLRNPFLKTTFTRLIPSSSLVTLYLCGPTVYGPLHLGNFRNVFLFDVLYRFLLRHKQKTQYWQNITDIDDKIIQKAIENKCSEATWAKKYFTAYQTLLKECQLYFPEMLFVSANMAAITNFIAQLTAKGFTYQTASGVYFNTAKLPKYALFQQTTHPVQQRNPFHTEKKTSRDFVIWKKTTTGKNWKSPWDDGRPGWHTECVSLITKFNHQNSLTIHGGGRDLIFPHHENEHAQFHALYAKPLAAFWLHNGLIVTTKGKISRSQNPHQSLNMAKLLQTYDHNVFRLFFFNQPYGKDILFSLAKLTTYAKIYQRWKRLFTVVQRHVILFRIPALTTVAVPITVRDQIERKIAANLGVEKIFPLLFAWEKKIQISLNQIWPLRMLKTAAYFRFALSTLGIELPVPTWTPAQKTLLFAWAKALKVRDYERADFYRHRLQEEKLWT